MSKRREAVTPDDGRTVKATDILPHREPFLFISRVLSITPGQKACAEYDVPPDLPVFQGHFPGQPVMPGVLILEFMAQTGALAVLSPQSAEGMIAYLAGIDSARFRRPVEPGVTLRAEVEVGSLRRGIGRGTGKVFVGDTEVASASIVFALRPRLGGV